MKKRKLKPFVIPSLYALAVICFVTSMYFISKIFNSSIFSNEQNELWYVDKSINDEGSSQTEIPVVGTEELIVKPYLTNDVTIGKNFYDYQDDNTTQENSLIYYENTYMQNSGIDYVSENQFEVVSILNGTVISVKEDSILGNVIEIKHNNDVISIYQSITDINVKVDDQVNQGQVIAKSSTANISKDLNNHLHFELYLKGQVVNPEDYYNKTIQELELS